MVSNLHLKIIIINYNFDLNYKESRFSAVVQIDKASVAAPENQQISTEVKISYENYFIKINLTFGYP